MILLVTDRTEADVMLRNSKGFYTVDDLNRVELAVKEICKSAQSIGIQMPLTTKTDWKEHNDFSLAEYPTHSQMERYINNIKIIKNTFSIPESIPQTMKLLTFEGANEIERVLEKAFLRIEAKKNTIFFCGEIFSGEER